MRDRALLGALATAVLGFAVLSPVSAPACDVCQLQLKHRTGPYAITLVKESRWRRQPQILITIANGGPRAVAVGGVGSSSRFDVNVVAPNYKSIEPIDRYVAPGHPALVRPHSRFTFRMKLRQWFDKPGVYRLNASLGNVDSNILTYTIK
jgi:hypothetical protein